MAEGKDLAFRNISLGFEVSNSINFIKKGLCELKKAEVEIYDNNIPFLLLATGFERLMKCIVCLRHFYINGEYPSIKSIKKLNHNLDELLKYILKECKKMKYDNRPATKVDMDFLMNDKKLIKINHLLSEFDKGARYYYLDIVTIGNSDYKEPCEMIQELEREIVSDNPELKKLMSDVAKTKEFNEKLNKELLIILERFVRALSRLFTLGELGKHGPKMIGYIRDFLFLRDNNLGEANYCEK